ncbi:MAG TPA: hypothetical protein ENK05_09010 [Gammaproteobacteria bacterium]|nr:hypothetical protein [Gammaproteobacteria bacterium]
MNPYYGVRRLGPYLGVIQVIDVGSACAYSTDGVNWRIRQRNPAGRLSWGIVQLREGDLSELRLANADELIDALEHHPPVPFPLRDRYELWLLHNESRKPLALLRTAYREQDMERVTDPHWRPFLLTDTAFVSPTLQRKEKEEPARGWPVPHRDQLESQVNMASRPMPAAQWFERREDGSGRGCGGLRLADEEIGRSLPGDDFPPLLISEDWDDEVQRALVIDYHDWHAAALLAHQNLDRALRRRLEKAACKRPRSLLGSYPLIPEVLDREAMEVALVSARIMAASP